MELFLVEGKTDIDRSTDNIVSWNIETVEKSIKYSYF